MQLTGTGPGFHVIHDDGAWKLYRDGELIAPYASRDLAEAAATRFINEIERVDGAAELRSISDRYGQKETIMKLARRALNDPDRRLELEEAFDGRLAELLAEANDAGYSVEEAVEALMSAAKHQAYAAGKDPDPADDPS